MIRGRRKCGCGKFYKQELLKCPSCGLSETFSDFIPYNPMDWVYDEETYPNVFTASFKHPNSGVRAFFEISERINQLNEFVVFLHALRDSGCRMIGFNNLGFDYPVTHLILQHYHSDIGCYEIYQKAQSIINTPWDQRFNNIIWESDVMIPQIDLMKIHHFDNSARATSLKMLEFNMRSQNIEDLPFEPGLALLPHQLPVLGKYNDHDVDETEKFYFESLEMIEFREELTERHGINFLNHSDKKIGTDLFVMELEKNSPGSCYSYDNGRKTKRQTIRVSIPLNDIIFPYINFERREFQLILEYLKAKTIKETKGAFEFLEVSFEMAMVMNPNLVKVYGLTPHDVPTIKNPQKGVLLSKCKDLIGDSARFKFVSGWKDQSGLNCIVDGFRFDFGTGGIHGSIDSATVCSDEEFVIYDWDVAGYYPSLGAANNLFPEHLSNQFGVVDAMLKEERAKHKKGTPLNTSIKLARNGAYGDSNNKYSCLFDSQYTMSITINGQLLLCLLAEHLIKIPKLQMIQINTDGLTIRCPRIYVDHMKTVCKWWENFTNLELESVIYSRMMIKDVNNYIAEYDGGVKLKGAYAYKREWHKNHSSLVIPRAAEAALVHGADIERFIRGHDDIFDFMLRSKVPRAEKLVMVDIDNQLHETQLQNITRYYVAKKGGMMVKVSPPAKGNQVGAWKRATKLSDNYYHSIIDELQAAPAPPDEPLDSTGLPWDPRINTKNCSKYEIRRTSVNAGWTVAPCNDIRDADFNNINYDYYIDEARKLVDPLRA